MELSEPAESGLEYTIKEPNGVYQLLIGLKRSVTVTFPTFKDENVQISEASGVNLTCGFSAPKTTENKGTKIKIDAFKTNDESDYRSCGVFISSGDKKLVVRLLRDSADWVQTYIYTGNEPNDTAARDGRFVLDKPITVYLGTTKVKEALVEVHGSDTAKVEKIKGGCKVDASDKTTKVVKGLDNAGTCELVVSDKIDGKIKQSVVKYER